MVNQAKIFAVQDLTEKLKAARAVALIDYQGLTAEQIAELRRKIKEAGGSVQVIKNTLISRALAQLGISLDQKLTGPTAIVFANEDEVSPLKLVDETAKQFEKPEFKLGVYQGKLLTKDRLQQLVQLPSRETLLAQIVGGLANPLSRLVYSLKFNQTKLVLVLKQIAEKGGENHD